MYYSLCQSSIYISFISLVAGEVELERHQLVAVVQLLSCDVVIPFGRGWSCTEKYLRPLDGQQIDLVYLLFFQVR
jgi:hypothetical protein